MNEELDVVDIVKLENTQYSILKLVEELAELQEVAIKMVTKPDINRNDKFVEEAGDVITRIQIVAEKLSLGNQVEYRRCSKLNEIAEWYRVRHSKIEEDV